MKYYEKYKTNINWDKFTSQENLLYGDKSIYIKNFIPNVDKLLSWKDIENHLNLSNLKYKFLDQTGTKTIFPPEIDYYNLSIHDKNNIKYHIEEGLTFNCWDYQQQNYNVNSICTEINDIFQVISEAQIFGSKKSSSISFPPHIDDYPLLIIQTYGDVNWKIYNEKPTHLWTRNQINTFIDIDKLKPPTTYTLSPGDFLYVPSRTFHQVESKNSRLTLSINCNSTQFLKNELDNTYYEIKN